MLRSHETELSRDSHPVGHYYCASKYTFKQFSLIYIFKVCENKLLRQWWWSAYIPFALAILVQILLKSTFIFFWKERKWTKRGRAWSKTNSLSFEKRLSLRKQMIRKWGNTLLVWLSTISLNCHLLGRRRK